MAFLFLFWGLGYGSGSHSLLPLLCTLGHADLFTDCKTYMVIFQFPLLILKVGNLEFKREQLFGMKNGISLKTKVCSMLPSLFYLRTRVNASFCFAVSS